AEQLADGLTKPLLKGKLEENRTRLGINSQHNIQQGQDDNQQRRHQMRVISPSVILGLLAFFLLSASATSQSPPVLWRKSPCTLIDGMFQPGIAEQAANKCEQLRKSEEGVIKELAKMCPKQSLRRKRFFDPISIFLFISIFATIAGIAAIDVGGTALSEVRTLASHTTEQDRMLNDLDAKVFHNHQAIQNLTKRFNEAIDELQAHQQDYAEFKGKYVNSTYTLAYITSHLWLGKSIIQQAARKWKAGNVDPALLEYFNASHLLPCGDRCPLDLA
ncbi:unnamed protein product, partial [Allacma fusca]